MPSPNRPAKGTKIERVWTIADERTRLTGRVASRADVIAQAVAEGLNAGTASTQYAAWKRSRPPIRSRRGVAVGTTAIQIKDAGRIVLPAELRAAIGASEGDTLLASVEGGAIKLVRRDDAIRRLQAKARSLVPSGTLVSDELIAERRKESGNE